VSNTNNSPPDGTPSRGSQKGLIALPPMGLQPRQPRGGLRPGVESRQGITPQFVLTAMRQWWKVATPIGLVLAGGIAALMLLVVFEKKYEAVAVLQIQDRPDPVIYTDQWYGHINPRLIDTQLQILQSPMLLGPVLNHKIQVGDSVYDVVSNLDQINKQPEKIRWLASQIQLTRRGVSQYFNISFTGPEDKGLTRFLRAQGKAAPPGQASAEIVNAVVTEYQTRWQKESDTFADRTIKLVKAEKDRRQQKVKELRTVVRGLSIEATGKDPFLVSSESPVMRVSPLSQLEANLAGAEANKAVLQIRLKVLKEEFDSACGLGLKGTTSEGGKTTIVLEGNGNDFLVSATKQDRMFANVRILFVNDKAVGDKAVVAFDGNAKALTVDIDPTATTARTVVDAINVEGTFSATLDKSESVASPQNDGSGLVCMVRFKNWDQRMQTAVAGDFEARELAGVLTLAQERCGELQDKVGNIEDERSPWHESYVRAKEAIARNEVRLAQRRNALAFGFRKDELAAMQSELTNQEALEGYLQGRREEERKRDDDKQRALGGDTAELEFARSDLEIAEKATEVIEQRLTALTIERGERDQVQIPQMAEASAVPVGVERRLALSLLGALAGLCLPFGLAVLWERSARRVTNAEQLEEHSSLGFIGEVARMPVRRSVLGESPSKSVGQSLGVFEESIDTLRTCLILSEPLKDMKVLAVTSGGSREGKTSVAVQLAVSIARASGQPTLLVDGDMRSPDLHSLLETPLEPGLGDVLARKCGLNEAIVHGWGEHLDFLPAGRAQISPHKLLGNGVVGQLFEEIRGAYRYVIVDTPPVLAAGEALILASAADATLICTMRDRSRLDQVRKTQERLLAAGARPVGIVLNGVPVRRYLYRYGHYGYATE